MSQIKIALVGRPNVGKSALFNRLCKKRIAIVDEEEGITRDRLYAETDFFGKPLTLIDTGGIDPHSLKTFNEEIKRQAYVAIEEADVLIMVVDGHCGVTKLDIEVANILFKSKKPLVLAVNKIDNKQQEFLVGEFYQLGIEKICPVSATQGYHLAELLEMSLEDVAGDLEIVEEPKHLKIAIVGRANVGKSTLLNYLVKEERTVVSPIPGTTRDSIDVWFTNEDKLYCLIDTAGIRRKKAENLVVDKYAAIRTHEAIERTDVCLFLLDATEGMTTQEKRIANKIEEAGKGAILVFNKWDLVNGYRMEHCKKAVLDEVPFFKHCPIVFISAKTGQNVDKLFKEISLVEEQMNMRIPTSKLNAFIEKCMQKRHPPMIGGKRLRIYFLTQIGSAPAKFVLFVNRKDLLCESYKKYLINQLREAFGFAGAPLQFFIREKSSRKE